MVIVHNLSKQFRLTAGRFVQAVDDVSFEVADGQVYGLLGANGAGKTTTLRIILGLLNADSGYAEVAGVRSDQNPRLTKSKIGFVSAESGLYSWLTCRELLTYFAGLYGKSESATAERIQELADVLDLTEFLDRRCNALSTGQRQRISLARALVHQPPLLLLDEPTRGLDVVGSQVVFDLVNHAREVGTSVLLSTHRLEQAERCCDRLGIMHHGKMAMEGSWSELQTRSTATTLRDLFAEMIRNDGKPTAEVPS